MPLQVPKPARQYSGLSSGPGWSRTYETQRGVPVDGSRRILRDPRYGSPFTFRVLPPPQLLGPLEAGGTRASADLVDPFARAGEINLVDAALRVNNDFAKFSSQIENFRTSSFVVQSNEDLVRLETLISNNGVQFNAKTGDASLANQPAISDLKQAASVIAQINRMLSTPPLTLLVNPQSMTITRTKKQQYSDRNRKGYVFQTWGHEQEKINIQGKTGAFIAGSRFTDSDAPENFRGLGAASRGRLSDTSAPSGVQFASKRDSASWQNLMSLLTIYRNNGYIYDLVTRTEAHQWIGGIAIDYDQWTYIGHFENFSYSYDDRNQLGGIEFTFDFTVSFLFDNAQREFVVLPIAAPTPSPSDPLWSVSNRSNRQAQFGTSRGRAAMLPNAAALHGTGAVLGAGAGSILRRGR